MEHLTDKQLLELLEKPAGWPDGVRTHLDGCEDCRRRWQGLQETWNALDAWTVEMPQIDLTDRVLERAVPVRTVLLWRPQTLVRVAASVALGLGLGMAAGRIGSTPVSAEEVSQAIYLDSLALNSSTGWAAPMLDESLEP